MLYEKQLEEIKRQIRSIGPPNKDNLDKLGPLRDLTGKWRGKGTGWNMISLPFVSKGFDAPRFYRLLLNQYDEELDFGLVDSAVPNRGMTLGDEEGGGPDSARHQTDQFLAAVEYTQTITQVAAADSPVSGLADKFNGKPIHREPGLWLHIANEVTNGLDIARLGSVPHGSSLLALGKSSTYDNPPNIPFTSGFPFGQPELPLDDPRNVYMSPYRTFIDNPFKGTFAGSDDFPGFNPAEPNELLRFINQDVDILETTQITVDTTLEDAGIVNIPFIVKQAEASEMRFTFWISKLNEKDINGDHKLRLQYSQVVILDFVPKENGLPGRILWPHVSINTLDKVVEKK